MSNKEQVIVNELDYDFAPGILDKMVKLNFHFYLNIPNGDLVKMALKLRFRSPHINNAEYKKSRVALESIIPVFDADLLNEVWIDMAVLEHKIATPSEFASNYSDLLASATLDEPNLVDVIHRAYRAKYDIYRLSSIERMQWGIEQVKVKYGTGGTFKYPKYYLEYYDKIINNFIIDVDKLQIPTARQAELLTRGESKDLHTAISSYIKRTSK